MTIVQECLYSCIMSTLHLNISMPKMFWKEIPVPPPLPPPCSFPHTSPPVSRTFYSLYYAEYNSTSPQHFSLQKHLALISCEVLLIFYHIVLLFLAPLFWFMYLQLSHNTLIDSGMEKLLWNFFCVWLHYFQKDCT